MNELNTYFTMWDQDGSRTISRAEIKELLGRMDLGHVEHFAENIVVQSDLNGDGQIDSTEFAIAFERGIGIGAIDVGQGERGRTRSVVAHLDRFRRYGLLLGALAVALVAAASWWYSWTILLGVGVLLAVFALAIRLHPGLAMGFWMARFGAKNVYQAFWKVLGPKRSEVLIRTPGRCPRHVLLTQNERQVAEVLSSPAQFVREKVDDYGPFNTESVLGAGTSEDWVRHRQAFNSYFSSGFREDLPLLRPIIEDGVGRWGANGDIDLLRELFKIVVEIRGQVFFQHSFGCFEDKEGEENFADLVARLLELPVFVQNKNPKQITELFHARILGAIKDSHKRGSIGGICRAALESGQMSGAEAIQNATVYALALAPTFAAFWVLYRAAKMGRCAELRADRVKLLQAIKEELRIHPPVTRLVTRVATEESKLGETVVPAGTEVVLGPFFSQNSAELWESPELYRPERWEIREDRAAELLWDRTDADDVAGRPTGCPHMAALARKEAPRPMRYFPFGAGQHKCQGRKFAAEELVVLIQTILDRVDLSVIEDRGLLDRPVQEQIKLHVFNAPAHKVRVGVRPASAGARGGGRSIRPHADPRTAP